MVDKRKLSWTINRENTFCFIVILFSGKGSVFAFERVEKPGMNVDNDDDVVIQCRRWFTFSIDRRFNCIVNEWTAFFASRFIWSSLRPVTIIYDDSRPISRRLSVSLGWTEHCYLLKYSRNHCHKQVYNKIRKALHSILHGWILTPEELGRKVQENKVQHHHR